jgi:DNA sulfur modification protein DndD
MYLKRIELKDWKAYLSASLHFPRPEKGRNVVLIGARNGFGKTSLFEAIVLGLFGRDGLPLIARAPFGSSAEDRVQVSYNDFLSESLHRGALEQGRQSASVALEFEDDSGEPLILRRIWHFAADGRHKPADEELRVFQGRDERLVGPPPNEDEVEWRRAFVARSLLPHTLASFFLFDGEQVHVLADRDMSAQVRAGIEGLLGVQILRELAADLRKYADARRYQAGGQVTPKNLDRLRNDLTILEHDFQRDTAFLETAKGEHERLSVRREMLTRELGSMGAGTGDLTVKERYEELNRVKRTLEELFEKLQEHVTSDISLALTGAGLRSATVSRLKSEEIREEWESGKRQGEIGLTRFLSSLQVGLASLFPPLSDSQSANVVELVRSNWNALWHPAPEGCAEAFRHCYVRGAERAKVRAHLEMIEHLSIADIGRLLERIARAETERHKLENEIAQLEGISPQLQSKVNELRLLNTEIDNLAQERGRLERQVEGLKQQTADKRQELAKYVKSLDRAGPSIRRAEWADRVANLTDAIVESAVPGEIDAVAGAMTRAFKAMSHKKIVERVEIGPDCAVRLLSGSGRDVRDMALSAGEQQIFAQALIAAVAEVSQRDFPILVDTPLGRLDDAHREGVLRHFTDRQGQLILLSTDTEVVNSYLDVVRPRLSSTWHVVHEHEGEIGRSRVERGYFPGTGV